MSRPLLPETSTRDASPGASPQFPTTSWTKIGRAGAGDTPAADEAMEALCRAYRYPLYAFLRRSGHSYEDAHDWAQSFFAYLLANRLVSKATPARGRFRSFLLASMKRFISTEHRKLAAQKRGGGQVLLSLDERNAEDRYAHEPVDAHTPETLFELSWARTILRQAAAALEKEYAAAGKSELFARLAGYLEGGREGPGYAATAAALGLSVDVIKTAVLRLRRRFQQCLREQIALTVSTPAEVEEELRHLRQLLMR